MHIAIDGPVASGKSTIGEAVARRLGILYLDTGVMYRAVALAALERGEDLGDNAACGAIAETIPLHLLPPTVADGRQLTVLLGDRDITWEIRTSAVNQIVPIVSGHPRVRAALRAQQQRIAAGQSVVMVGRDIASIVLPDARVKVMLAASPAERLRRRAAEVAQRNAFVDLDALRAEIEQRDAGDQANLHLTPDTLIIDTDGRTIDQIVADIVEVARERYG